MVQICATWLQKRECLSFLSLNYVNNGRRSGLFAIKDYRESINQDDFNKAVRKVAESKKLEGKLDYKKL